MPRNRLLEISYPAVTFTAILLLVCSRVFAMPANPAAFDIYQPDGTAAKLHIRGDEWFHWYEDIEGYTVVRDNGRYAYAQLDPKGKLSPTLLTVGKDNPQAAGLKKRILPSLESRRSLRPAMLSGDQTSAVPQAAPPSGVVKNLVVLCLFSNHTIGTHARNPGDYNILFNQTGGDTTLAPTGSVKDLYLENSYGQMTLESTVTVWVTLPQTEAYYANNQDGTGSYPRNAQKMVEDALYLVDPLVNFDQFDSDNDGYIDAIDIIHSGYGAETGGGGGNWIWSHRWVISTWTSGEGVKVRDYHTEPALWGTSGTAIVRFGVIAHETGHFFGLPDLYDTDGSGEGIGSWGLMANSWGFDYSQLHPPHFCAWSKIFLGWVTPTVLSAPGLYTIGQAETNPQVYRISNGYPSGEYLLIENRQPAGIETAIPQGGLCVYHIDEQAGYNTEGYPGQSGWPENGNHYRVAVLQADGNYNLEKNNNRGDSGDVYRAGGVTEIGPGPGNYPNTDAYQDGIILATNNTIHSISAAGAMMSFVYDNGIQPQPPYASDSTINTPLNTPVVIALQAMDEGLPNPPGGLSYTITSLPEHGTVTEPNGLAIDFVPHLLTNSGNQVVYTPKSGCGAPASFTFIANDGGTAPDGGPSNQAAVAIQILILTTIYSAEMDTNPGWTTEGLWQWGIPTGQGGPKGNPDPTSGFTGSNVVGYNLLGDYGQIGSTQWATTPAINCTGKTGVTLKFYRWLNVDSAWSDNAYIEVSNNGSTWTEIWRNPAAKITDASWALQTFDISAIADNQPMVYIRWGMGPTNNNQHYSGWNIDDVQITGIVAFVPTTGDFEPDCDVDFDDLTLLMSYWLQLCGDCQGTDLLADGIVNLEDFALFAQNWLAE